MDNDMIFRVEEQYGFEVMWNGQCHYLESKIVKLGPDTQAVLQIHDSHDHPDMVQLCTTIQRGTKIVSTAWQYLDLV